MRAALFLVALTDDRGRALQPGQRSQEPLVGRVHPPDESRTAPATLAKSVEPAVVTHSVCRIGLHGVPAEITESSPGLEMTRIVGEQARDLVSAGVGVVEGHCLLEAFVGLGRLGAEDGLGWA